VTQQVWCPDLFYFVKCPTCEYIDFRH
jgi:hypothetical protein